MNNDHPDTIFKKWPDEVIRENLEVLRDTIHNGGGIEELQAGLLAIDYLTRGSDLTESTAIWVESLIAECTMRIELMAAFDRQSRTPKEVYDQILRQVKQLQRSFKDIDRIIDAARGRFSSYAELREYIQKRYHS